MLVSLQRAGDRRRKGKVVGNGDKVEGPRMGEVLA
jgi:hypothetical protein